MYQTLDFILCCVYDIAPQGSKQLHPISADDWMKKSLFFAKHSIPVILHIFPAKNIKSIYYLWFFNFVQYVNGAI